MPGVSEDAGPMIVDYAPPLSWHRRLDPVLIGCGLVGAVVLLFQLLSFARPVELTVTRAKQYALVSQDGFLGLQVRTPVGIPNGPAVGPMSGHWIVKFAYIRRERLAWGGPMIGLTRIASIPHVVLFMLIVVPILVLRHRRGRARLLSADAPPQADKVAAA